MFKPQIIGKTRKSLGISLSNRCGHLDAGAVRDYYVNIEISRRGEQGYYHGNA